MSAELYEDRQIRLALERGDEASAARWRRIKARVDQAPPLSAIPAVRDRLAVLLRPAPAPQVSPPRRRAAERQQAA